MLGLTSLVTDISSEMVTSILPAYLIFARGISPTTFGVLDGLYQGGASVARLLSGLVTDRLRRYREVAAIGYVGLGPRRSGPAQRAQGTRKWEGGGLA